MRSLIVLVFFSVSVGSFAQDTTVASNAIYLELGGNAGYGSLNYERMILSKNKFQLSVRAGLSTLKMVDYRDKFNPDIIIPVALNVTYGNNHKIETGIGSTYTNMVNVGGNLSPERTSVLNGNLHLGYRYQKSNGGILFRVCYTPLFESFNSFRHWAGISVGYTF